MSSGGSNNVSLKYERFASSGCRDLGIIKLGFVAKTQFLYKLIVEKMYKCRRCFFLKKVICESPNNK